MKILFIINILQTGGAELQMINLAKTLQQHPHNEVKVISLKSLGNIDVSLLDGNISVSTLNLNLFNMPMAFIKLIRHIAKFKPDVIHCWMYYANVFGGVASRLAGHKNLIWAIHHNDLSYKYNKVSSVLIAKLGALLSWFIPKRIICVSERALKTHVRHGYAKDRCLIVENAIDIQYFNINKDAGQRKREELLLSPLTKVLGFFGRYDPLKNQKGFLRGIATFKRNTGFNDFCVLIVGGDCDDKNIELTELIIELDLVQNIKLLGIRRDMAELYNALDLYVMMSFNESFSLVIAEAMSCGIPCLATQESDPVGLLDNYGIIMEANNENCLARNLQEILLDNRPQHIGPELRRDIIVKRFELSRQTEKHINLYKTVTEN